ncbi:phosphoenolpyruvate--protein phosphotransferase [Pantoea sp. B65]|uniref:phosphoenolpyruvate--protein phosphotransferase n=1 Tax=Pantoea sp. B65 TaxID=2813359 RepID=UPI0039B4B359
MSEYIKYCCDLKEGIHARPASHIERLSNTFIAEVHWTNQRTGISGDGKSALSLVSTDTLTGDACLITISGEDEIDASFKLEDLLAKLPGLEGDQPEAVENEARVCLPRTLQETTPHFFQGTRISGGVARGKAQFTRAFSFATLREHLAAAHLPTSAGLNRFLNGLEQLKTAKQQSLATAKGVEHDILSAHLSIINDATFHHRVKELISAGTDCSLAIVNAAEAFCLTLENSASNYIRERALDVKDIALQLVTAIYGEQAVPQDPCSLSENTILFADSLTPSKFIALNKHYLKGLVLTNTGKTSHTAILARSLGIPALTDIDFSLLADAEQQPVIIDGDLGIIIIQASERVRRYYQLESQLNEGIAQQMLAESAACAVTQDGHRVDVAANIASYLEASVAFRTGAEGIGLYRSEMAYMDRATPPDEDELMYSYIEVIKLAQGKPVIFRTIDIGGDKPVEYLNIAPEENPFLGYRAIRIYPQFIDIFTCQLRAILRASGFGQAKIMIPMIANAAEIKWCITIIDQLKQQLAADGIAFNPEIEVGIMLEVPSVIFSIREIARHVDFFSVGSNDLTQYFFAADRGNSRVEHLYDSYHPAFLRALQFAVSEIHACGKWVGLCGELGAATDILPALIGIGFDELSMSASAIPQVKSRIKKLSLPDCRQLAAAVCQCPDSAAVREQLRQFSQSLAQAKPIIALDCIEPDLHAQDRNEVIKRLTDNLFIRQRSENRSQLADDIWSREDAFATSVGFGFAIPHTKSAHIINSTISIARLSEPVLWGEHPVSIVFMLTINQQGNENQHMKYFSLLARKIMDEQFRHEIASAVSREDIYSVVMRNLAMDVV